MGGTETQKEGLGRLRSRKEGGRESEIRNRDQWGGWRGAEIPPPQERTQKWGRCQTQRGAGVQVAEQKKKRMEPLTGCSRERKMGSSKELGNPRDQSRRRTRTDVGGLPHPSTGPARQPCRRSGARGRRGEKPLDPALSKPAPRDPGTLGPRSPVQPPEGATRQLAKLLLAELHGGGPRRSPRPRARAAVSGIPGSAPARPGPAAPLGGKEAASAAGCRGRGLRWTRRRGGA